MSNPENANYLLIDGALRPGALNELFKDDPAAQVNPLYMGTRWSELHSQGPILIKLETGSPWLSEWLNEPRKQEDSTLLLSNEPLDVVARHLRHFLSPPDVLGGNGLLRFADPLVAHFWLSSFSVSQMSERLGPIESWWVGRPTHSWQTLAQNNWQTFSRTVSENNWQAEFAQMDHPQLAALERAQRWQLEERFYQWLNERSRAFFGLMDSQQISEWLHTTIDTGLAWGLITERGLIIWAEIRIDWGNDFADQQDGPFRAWLNLNPDHACLSPELLIEALDNYRYSHKDIAHG